MTISRAEDDLVKVILGHDAEVLVATIVFDAPHPGRFAFHVFRNGERIHTKRVATHPVLRFDTKGEPGLYRVLVVFESPNAKKISKYSNPLFLHPVTYRLDGGLRKPLPTDRTLLLHGIHWKFPAVYYVGKEGQPLFVMLSAAIDRNKQTLPVFNRCNWADKFPGHVLCVADPTLELHDDMKLGWYLGTDEHDASEELSRFVRSFAEALGIPEGKVVLWGSSGGGFAALALASRIEKATAVAINPQTDIFAYEKARTIEAVRRHCFGNQTAKHIQEHFGPRVNMAQAWRSNRSSRVILIQNKLDTHHHACHFKSFWEALGGTNQGEATADGCHYAWLYSDSRGHGAESEQMVPEILNLINQDSFTASTVMPTIRAANE